MGGWREGGRERRAGRGGGGETVARLMGLKCAAWLHRGHNEASTRSHGQNT